MYGSGSTGIHDVVPVFKMVDRISIDDVFGKSDIISFATHGSKIFSLEINLGVMAFKS